MAAWRTWIRTRRGDLAHGPGVARAAEEERTGKTRQNSVGNGVTQQAHATQHEIATGNAAEQAAR